MDPAQLRDAFAALNPLVKIGDLYKELSLGKIPKDQRPPATEQGRQQREVRNLYLLSMTADAVARVDLSFKVETLCHVASRCRYFKAKLQRTSLSIIRRRPFISLCVNSKVLNMFLCAFVSGFTRVCVCVCVCVCDRVCV